MRRRSVFYILLVGALLSWGGFKFFHHDDKEFQRHALYGTPCEEVLERSGGAQANCVTIYYGTTRAPEFLDAQNLKETNRIIDRFTNRFADRLYFGQADVSLPFLASPEFEEGRQRGEVVYAKDAPPSGKSQTEQNVSLTIISETGRETFVADLSDAISRRENSLLLFIHGFNVTFDAAVVRTAQLAADLTFDPDIPPEETEYAFGQPVLFSWPNGGQVIAYRRDQKMAEASSRHLTEFLKLLSDETDARTINIIVHSMGNRVLVESIRQYAESYVQQEAREIDFRIIHAAADVDQDVYDAVMDEIEKKSFSADFTIYASSEDIPLAISRFVNSVVTKVRQWLGTAPQEKRGRLGQITDDGIYVRDGVTSIDATGFATDLYGHGYFSDNGNILSDIACELSGVDILQRPLNPDTRLWRGIPYTFYSIDRTAGEGRCAIRTPTPYTQNATAHLERYGALTSLKVCWDGTSVPADAQCPPPIIEEAEPEIEDIYATIYFDLSKAALSPRSESLLAELASRALANDIARITVTGHTDTAGDETMNAALSLRRAEIVRDALIARGIPAYKIEIIAKGELEPAQPTADGVREPLNRRVEITIQFE